MAKLQIHPSADVAALQHGTSPGRTRNGYPNWFWTVEGVSRDKRLVITQKHNLIAVMLGLNLQYSRGWQSLRNTPPSTSDCTMFRFTLSVRLG